MSVKWIREEIPDQLKGETVALIGTVQRPKCVVLQELNESGKMIADGVPPQGSIRMSQ